MGRMRKHTLGQQGHVPLAMGVVVGLREETVYKEGRSELCCAHLADGMAEWLGGGLAGTQPGAPCA